MKPHRISYWMNPQESDPVELEKRIRDVCEIYEQTAELERQGWKVFSTDEKTGIQALERKHVDKPVQVGKPRLVEFEYIRHGTLNLIADFEVISGRVKNCTYGQTRTEKDFLGHIKRGIKQHSEAAGWIYIVDQLNTHQSESLVRLVAEIEGLEEAGLGVKGKSGIMRSMPSRREFLADENHRLRFIYTPKHCSWLNQIEIWFSILARKFIKWGNFTGREDLKKQLKKFISYFNKTMAKAFKWTYKGKVLRI